MGSVKIKAASEMVMGAVSGLSGNIFELFSLLFQRMIPAVAPKESKKAGLPNSIGRVRRIIHPAKQRECKGALFRVNQGPTSEADAIMQAR